MEPAEGIPSDLRRLERHERIHANGVPKFDAQRTERGSCTQTRTEIKTCVRGQILGLYERVRFSRIITARSNHDRQGCPVSSS